MSGSSTRILYVITDLELGGVPLHLHRLVRAVRKRGLAASVVSLAPAGPVARMLCDDGVDVQSCQAHSGWDFRVIGRLAGIITRDRPDLIHSLLFHANIATRRAAHKAAFPKERVICEIQTVEVERPWHLLLDRFMHRGCHVTVGNSPSVVEHLHLHAHIPHDRLRLVRGGIDPVSFRDAMPIDRSVLGLADDAMLLLWVGRLDPVKGIRSLIAAFGLLSDEVDSHLLLVGEGPYRDRLVKLIRRSGLTGRTHLLGARQDVPALLKTADVFAFPSRTEGLPNALLEAMAAGCPIVTTDVPGCRDLIEHEHTGLLVPYNDTCALAGALHRLLRDREAARRFGRQATKIVTDSWHIDQTHQAYAALYEEVIAGG